MLDVNVVGSFLVTLSVGRVMKEQDFTPCTQSPERAVTRGTIVHLGSGAAYTAAPGQCPYTVSKHAVLGLSRSAGKPLKLSDEAFLDPLYRFLNRRRQSEDLFADSSVVISHRPRWVRCSRQLPMSRMDRYSSSSARQRAHTWPGRNDEETGPCRPSWNGRGDGRCNHLPVQSSS